MKLEAIRLFPRRLSAALCPLLALSFLALGLDDSHARTFQKHGIRSKRPQSTAAETPTAEPAAQKIPPRKFRLPFHKTTAAEEQEISAAPETAAHPPQKTAATPAPPAVPDTATTAPSPSLFDLFKRKNTKNTESSATPKPPSPPAAKPTEETKTEKSEKKSFFAGFHPRSAPEAKKEPPSSSAKKPSPSRLSWLTREAPKPLPEEKATIVRVQIFLDNRNFGPGKIDGSLGGFTETAALFYNRSRGIEDENWYYLLKDSEKTVREIHRPYTIRDEDWRYVGSLPYSPPDQAKGTYMPYRSMREFLAERFHAAEKYLKTINPGRSLSNLKTGDTVFVPNVEPFRIEDIKKNHHFKSAASLSQRHVIVDTKQKMAFIMDNKEQQNLVATFPVTPGHQRYIPYGDWNIDTMVTTPSFRYDKQMLKEGVRGDDFHMLPPGPNSPVGIFWAGLTKSGIGLHGTNNPETIGRARSSGCIRLANWDAVRLSNLVRPGATVHVK